MAPLAVVLMAGCSTPGPTLPQLTVLGNVNEVVDVETSVVPNDSLSFGSMMLCLDKPGAVTVTSVSPFRATGHITVHDFMLRKNPLWAHTGASLLEANSNLARAGFRGARRVDVVCDHRIGRGYELGVQISKPTDTPASLKGFTIEYHSQGETGQLLFPYTIVLCSQPRASIPRCPDPNSSG